MQGRRHRRANTRGAAAAVTTTIRKKNRPPKIRAATDDLSWWETISNYCEALDSIAEVERPEYLCALSKELMRVPAMLCVDGVASHTYEHREIATWVNTRVANHEPLTEPITNEILPADRTTVVTNRDRQREIRAWAEMKVAVWQAEEAASATKGLKSLHPL